MVTADTLASGEALAGRGVQYRFQGGIGSARWPIYLADGELGEVLRRVALEQLPRGGSRAILTAGVAAICRTATVRCSEETLGYRTVRYPCADG